MTEAEIETSAASDPDHPGLDEAFLERLAALPLFEETISIRLDEDVLSFFRKTGRLYETHINAVLRRYVERQEKHR